MLSARLTVINDLGLHARAAARLVKGVSPFQSKVLVKRTDSDRSADARSILSILMLAAMKGTEVEIVAEGADESEALSAVCSLFAEGFGEL